MYRAMGRYAPPRRFISARAHYIWWINDIEVSMKEPQAMSLEEIRADLQRVGVTPRYISFVLRELAAVEERINRAEGASGRRAGDKPQYDVMTAHLNVLRQHGMTNRDMTLNRKGQLFVELANREIQEENNEAA
ncbi:MAG TPA: hypothetical protein VGD08_18185 [Stellaceae bacterium]|jgi:hypothetical protein